MKKQELLKRIEELEKLTNELRVRITMLELERSPLIPYPQPYIMPYPYQPPYTITYKTDVT